MRQLKIATHFLYCTNNSSFHLINILTTMVQCNEIALYKMNTMKITRCKECPSVVIILKNYAK